MSGGSLKVVDGTGREIVGAIDNQPLRVQLELDIDPDSAPDEITVEIVGPDGTKKSVEAERIDWGADRPLYQSDLTTIDDIFSQFLETLDPLLGHAPPRVNNGEFVQFEYDDLTQGVQTFDTNIDARYWYTQAELSDRTGAATTSAINLTNALKELRKRPESEERSQIEAELEARLQRVNGELRVLELARRTLNNPDLYAEQQIRGAQYYLSVGHDHRNAFKIGEVLESAKETAEGHIISGVAIFTLGGYSMLVQSTGVAQARTMLIGEDEMGRTVGWDGRVVAFCDLVADGALQGASMKFELDYLVAPTRTPHVDTRPRYDGPKPEKYAPEGSIVDPKSMGMTPEAARAAFRAARIYDKHVLVRPTNPDSLSHLEGGALPKMEGLKSKTVGEIDTLLGVAPEARGTVGFFDPKTDFFESGLKASGMSGTDVARQMDALRSGTAIDPPPGYAGPDVWNAAVKRYHQRSEEFHGPTGAATRKLVEAGEITIVDGVVYNTKTGQVYAGDHDLFDFIDSMGLPVTPEVYAGMVSYLEASAFRAQHGAHKWWDPQRSDFSAGAYGDAKYATNRGIYEKIIENHRNGEILIVFPPVGPPIALFSGTAPGMYLGHVPGPWAPVSPGSSFTLPSEIRLLGITGAVERSLQFDDSVTDWIEADAEFRAQRETDESSGSEEAFEAEAAALAARTAQFESEIEIAERQDQEETGEEFDAYETDEPIPSDESAKYSKSLIAVAATIATILLFGGFFWFSQGASDTTTGETTASPDSEVTRTAGTSDSTPQEAGGATETDPDTVPPTDSVEDLAAAAASPEFFDCPVDHQLDIIGRLLSGKDGEQSELDAETETELASNLICTNYAVGSHVFTSIVEGDGESLSMADNTSYQVSFVVNNEWPANEFYDDSGFVVHVSWQRLAQAFAGQVLDSDQFNAQPIEGAKVHIEWLDQSTLQVIADIPGDQVDVIEVRTELYVYITDENGNFVDESFDIAIWNAGP